LTVFVNIILPILLMAGLGYLLERCLPLDVRTLSRVTFYLLSPCLAFSSLSTSRLDHQVLLRMAAVAALVVVVLWPVAGTAARVLGWKGADRSAFLLAVLFMNTGNYGLPLNLFAYGNAGLALAIVFFATTSLLTNTFGIYIAARGRASPREAIVKVFQVPIGYAVIAGLLVNITGMTVPTPLARATDTLGQAAVPVMLLVLGMQLARVSLVGQWLPIATATVLRLVGSMAVAAVLVHVVGLQGLGARVATVEASMPTAVITTILATEFDTRPGFVTATVFVSTLASVVTLTLLLQWLA
jgi:hypothetical protein